MCIHGYVLFVFFCNNYAVTYCGNIYKILYLGMARPIHMLVSHGKIMVLLGFLVTFV